MCYLSAAVGGISHFHYRRYNVVLTAMYLRLFAGSLLRMPLLLARRIRAPGAAPRE